MRVNVKPPSTTRNVSTLQMLARNAMVRRAEPAELHCTGELDDLAAESGWTSERWASAPTDPLKTLKRCPRSTFSHRQIGCEALKGPAAADGPTRLVGVDHDRSRVISPRARTHSMPGQSSRAITTSTQTHNEPVYLGRRCPVRRRGCADEERRLSAVPRAVSDIRAPPHGCHVRTTITLAVHYLPRLPVVERRRVNTRF